MVGRAESEWTSRAVDRLSAHGYKEVPIELRDSFEAQSVKAFRRADFRISWMLTRLHTFVVLRVAPAPTAEDVAQFTSAALRWAVKAKGGLPRWCGSGAAVIAVTITSEASDPSAIAEAGRRPDKDWGAFRVPMLVEVEREVATTYGGDITWGLIYQHFLGQQQRLVMGELAGDTMEVERRRDRRRSSFGILCAVLFVTSFVTAALTWLVTLTT